ncbi:MAG: type pilus assembly protein PilE [Pseudomonadota bacterium]|nr:type pilus assembly protein PilE [Pseudomonadota bacterium]
MVMKRQHGFTLIELMIVVAVMGILAAIAYPSYQDSVRKSRRADARAVLLEAAQFMERRYTENLTAGYGGVTLPAALQAAPKDGNPKYYNVTLTNLAQNTFTLNAAPTGAQSSDACGTLTVTNTGAKGQATGKTVDDCWR